MPEPIKAGRTYPSLAGSWHHEVERVADGSVFYTAWPTGQQCQTTIGNFMGRVGPALPAESGGE